MSSHDDAWRLRLRSRALPGDRIRSAKPIAKDAEMPPRDSGHPHLPSTGTGCCATVEIISPCRFDATIVIFARSTAS
jgi:hypothetical protein